MRVMVTGGAGFIGSALVRQLVEHSNHDVMVVDKLTYAGSLSNLQSVAHAPQFRFIQADICDAIGMRRVFDEFDPDVIAHLAAESHVDRSIDGPGQFIQTNIFGTFVLLQESLRHWRGLGAQRSRSFRFHHISTDEVFGSLGKSGLFTETTPYDPRSPYAASKASADHLVSAWWHTFGLPILITNCSNNYGPYHFPEKLIPCMIIRALAEKSLPVYGRGDQVRDWLHVEDHARALQLVFEKSEPGKSYNIGGFNERTNLTVVRAICAELDALRPRSKGRYEDLIAFVEDRPGHDQRYAIDPSRLATDLGWKAQISFDAGLAQTVRWYLDNEVWWRTIQDRGFAGERLGLEGDGNEV